MGIVTWPTASSSYGPDPTAWSASERSAVLDVADISIFYLNADSEFCNDQTGLADGIMCAPAEPEFCRVTDPNLESGTTMRLVPPPSVAPPDFLFRAGTSLSFFILPDGFTTDLRTDIFGDTTGELLTDLLWAVSTLNEPSLEGETDALGLDVREHTVVFPGPSNAGGFDFSDMIIYRYETCWVTMSRRL